MSAMGSVSWLRSPAETPAVPDGGERIRLEQMQSALLNILDDFGSERERLALMQRAVLNILDDFGGEKIRLEETQKAILNILEDFDEEKQNVETVNRNMRREISERAQAESALRERTRQLARSNADLEQFAYAASHDLQEPLRMVSTYVQLFERRFRGQVDEQADKYIRYAVEGAQRMQALIAGLLEYSRVGRHEAAMSQTSSEDAFERALENLRRAREESGTTITHRPLPSVLVDGGQLTQVFQNLLANAIKFRRTDSPPHIDVSAEPSGSEWVFTVKDNGIGLDPQFADRIFVIFQRLHTREEYPGTGIGLSICKKVVERHGGRIWVESVPGEGAAFRFTLPAATRS